MMFHTQPPSRPIADFVERLWLHQGSVPSGALDRVLPCGREEILINLSDGELRCYHDNGRLNGRTPGPIFSGLHRGAYLIDTRQQSAIMGVHFKPGGAWCLLGLPVGELTDTRVAMADLLPGETRQLMDRLMQAGCPRDRLGILDAALVARRLKKSKPLHSAVAWASHQISRYPETVRIGHLAEESGISNKRFSELFTRQIGLNPKTFARLRRFQETVIRVHATRDPDWCGLALAMGYADQAHLIRDFRAFSGLTPAAYHARRGPFPHLVRLPEPPSDFFNTDRRSEGMLAGRSYSDSHSYELESIPKKS